MAQPNGRPTLLTPELAHRLYDFIRNGAPIKAACRAVGLGYETFRQWRQPCELTEPEHQHNARCMHLVETMRWLDGELKGTGQFEEFPALVEIALGEHETRLALQFTRGSDTDWHAAEAMLRRRYPEHWGVVEKTEQTLTIEVRPARERLAERVRESRNRLEELDIVPRALENGGKEN